MVERKRRRGSKVLQDPLWILLAGIALLAVGGALNLFDGFLALVHEQLGGVEDEIAVGLLIITLVLLLLFLQRRSNERREVGARIETEATLRTLVEQMPAVLYTRDLDAPTGPQVLPYVSPQVERILGFTEDDWVEDPELWSRQLHPLDRERVLRAFAQIRRTGEPLAIEYRRLRKDGAVIWVRDESAVVERDQTGRPSLVQGIVFDITERRAAEDSRREAEARYRALVEQVPAVTYTWDPSTPIGSVAAPFVSPQIEHLLGYPLEEWQADPGLWQSRVHWEDRDRVLEQWDIAIRTRGAFRAEYRIAARDGRQVWLRDEAVPVSGDGATRRLYQGVMYDITERKRAEQQLIEAQERFRALVEQIPAVVYIEDPTSGRSVYISPQVEHMFGYTPTEWMKDPTLWAERLRPEGRERVLTEDAGGGGERWSEEYRTVHRDGGLLWVQNEAVLIRDQDGHPLLWQGVVFDVTDRKLAEERLRQAEETYRTLVEQLPIVVYQDAIDDRSTALYVSPQVERMFGYPPEAMLEDPEFWIQHLHPEDRDRVVAESLRTNETGDPFVTDYRFLAVDGRVVWVRDEAVLLRDTQGTPLFWQGALSDITMLKETEEQLRDTEAKYRALVEHIPAVLYVRPADEHGRSVYVSPQIRDVLGVSQEEYLGDGDLWLDLIHPDDRGSVVGAHRASVDHATGSRIEYRVIRPDTGEPVWIRDESVVLPGGDDTPSIVQGVMFDVTERKLAEQALRESERREREAAERLRTLDEMKNTFLAAVSHELRSPLTSILGLAITLEHTRLPKEDQVDLLERLATNARKLDRLLSDLLDIDRLNRGIVTPNYRPTDIGALVRRTVEALDLLAERRILVEAEPAKVLADPAKIERIVENLVANAARHTEPETGIWVRVWPEHDGVLIAVEDEGPGVPKELQVEIFEPFRQGPTASPHAPGTGIGLSLVAMFADLHGGRAWVQDREGGGASFRVFLPNDPDACARPSLGADVSPIPIAEAG
jgi:PAS domain S-box-containing protein